MTAHETVLLCEDSMTGIFTGIYEAYEKRKPLASLHLTTKEEAQTSLFTVHETVLPKEEKAQKVRNTLKNRFSREDYTAICYALSSPDERKADAVFHTIVYGLKKTDSRSVLEHLSSDAVRITMELARNVNNEYQHLQGFTRFTELKGGILYGVISPSNDILPLLAAHFADRFPNENFVLADEGRNRYALHPAYRTWYLFAPAQEIQDAGDTGEDTAGTDSFTVEWSGQEACYRELFRNFCHNISIEERKNLKLQRNMLPLHFRLYMTEFQDRNQSGNL